MENKLQEDKKDTGGSLTVLKEHLPEKKKTFRLQKLVEISKKKNEVAHSKRDSTSSILHRI